jgi:acetolactate synthase-1/2/3 large subunit
MRLYGELREVLDRDAIVISDGGDFVSYAGRVMDTYEPGCWLDPNPYGCLGCGPGYALAAKLARPDRQVVLLLGDGAFGFSGMEFDALARHGVAVVGALGNNGIWRPREAPDGVPVRLLGGRGPSARDALRRGRPRARRPRRARGAAG